jgi:MFS family permease
VTAAAGTDTDTDTATDTAANREPAGGTAALLRLPPFRRYLIGQTLSAFGDSLMPVALVFAVLALGHGPTGVGLVLLAARVPPILTVLLGGAVGDRFDRRTIMLVSDVVRGACQAGTAVLLLTGHASLWTLALLQALSGAAGAFFGPAAAGLVRGLAPPHALSRANALLGIGRNTVGIGGVACAGVLVATTGPGWAFAADAATFALSAAFLARLPARAAASAGPAGPGGLLRAALGGLREAAARRWVWASICYVASINLMVICPFLVLGPVVADRDLGGPGGWAAVVIAYAAGGIAGNAAALRWRPRYPLRVAFAGAVALSPLMFLLAQSAPVTAVAVAGVAAGAQASIFNVFHGTTLQSHIPDGLVSRINAVNALGGLAAVPLGLSLAGAAAAATSTGTVLAVAGAFAVAGTAAVLLVPDVRNLARRPAAS